LLVGGLPLLDQVALGDHVCWTVDDDAARLAAIAGFVRAGLRARQRVLYCGDDPREVLAGLDRHGVCTRSAIDVGLLRAGPAEASYLAGGFFDPVATLRLWRREVALARAAGCPGIRVVGDMSWASRGVAGADRLTWYEAEVNTVIMEGYVAGVCAYDRRRFDPLQLRRLSRAHTGTATTAIAFQPEAALRASPLAGRTGLRLAGEVDLSNREAFRALVGHVFDHGPEATVDLSALTFADIAAARILVDAAARGNGRLHLTGCSRRLRRLLDFHGADGVAGLTVEAT
jgi:anti-anti-sigma factor